MKRKDIKFKELLKNDLDAAEIFNKAIELADIRHRHYYYSEEFLNQTLDVQKRNKDFDKFHNDYRYIDIYYAIMMLVTQVRKRIEG